MATCPKCAELLPADASACPACGNDLFARPPLPEYVEDRDEEKDRAELLTAAIAAEGTSVPPPPWVPSLEPPKPTDPVLLEGDELRDVVPVGGSKRRWRRKP